MSTFTDLTSTFSYKSLGIWTNMDELAENDNLFNDLLTAVQDIPNNIRFDNNFGIAGEVVAGGSYTTIAKLNASDQVELGTTLKNPTVDADPSAVLQVSTKQFTEAAVMRIGLVARVTATSTSASLMDVINITKVGRLLGVLLTANSNPYYGGVTVIMDGVDYGELTAAAIGAHTVEMNDAQSTTMFKLTAASSSIALNLFFKTSLQIRLRALQAGGGGTDCYVIYERQT